MQFLKWIWKRFTQTRALDDSSGQFETDFFENVYRVRYLAGLSVYKESFKYCIYSLAVKLIIILFVMSELWYLFSESSNLDKIIDNINVTLIHLIALYRYQDLITHKNIYKRLAAAMESKDFDLTTPKRRKLLTFWVKRSERYLKILLGLGSCTLAAWYIYPLVDDLEYNLTVAVKLPFDFKSPGYYAATYFAVLVAFNYTSYFVMVNDLIMQVHLMHLLCQFTVLADCFENILEDCCSRPDICRLQYTDLLWQELYLERLGNLVNQHRLIMQNTMELKKILSTPMLFQFLASSMLICFAGYQVTSTVKESLPKFLMSLLYLGYNMFELFIFCRWCEEIKVQSENIASAVYSSGWEKGVSSLPGVRSRLMLIISRSRKPVILSAGGLYALSLASYSTLVKTSYSALTVLLRVGDD